MLEKTAHQHAFVARQRRLGAVAVVHVEIHDRDTRQSVVRDGMARGNRHIAQEAKTHGLVRAGMVAGRPHRAERRLALARQHGVHGRDGGARRVQGRRIGMGIHAGIRVELDIASTGERSTSDSRYSDVWTRSSDSCVARGASRSTRCAATPDASNWSEIASSRAGHSGCPAPISCNLHAGCVK